MHIKARTLRFGLIAIAVLALCVFGYFLLNRVALPEITAAAKKVVRVGVYQNPPKIYFSDAGEPAGLFMDLIEAIARRENWRLEFISCSWRDCLARLEAAQIDLMPDVALSEQRSRRFDFHRIPVTHSWSVILTPVSAPVISLPKLNRSRIALLSGAIQAKPLDAMMTGHGLTYTPVGYPSYAAAFAAVRDGEADAVVSNSYYAGFYGRRYGLRETPIVFNPAALFFATSKGDPLGLLPRIDAHLEAWRYDEDSVYYAALKSAMVPAQEPVVPPTLRHLMVAIIGMLLMLLSMSAVLRWQVKRRTAQLRETAHRLDHMLSSSPVVLYQLSMADGCIDTRWVSDNVERLFGFAAERFVADNCWPRQLHAEDREAVLNNLDVLFQTGHLVQEYRIHDARGEVRFVRDEMRLLPGKTDQLDEIVGSWNDLTESHEQAARLSFLTHYDPLTRLPNRVLLRERLTHAVYRARRENRALAVLYIDIDRFKTINESLGHNLGDTVLRALAHRLESLLRTDVNLARVGGDGFVLLMENDVGRTTAEAMAEKIMNALVEPIQLGNQKVALTLSIGINLFPGDNGDADTFLQHAEAAMYEAKRAGRNMYRLYSPSLSVGVAERLSLESALRFAVKNKELVLHYQPQIDLSSNRLVGVEALVRWQHPELGLVSPGRFIPLAEEMGIIGEIGAWVLVEACRQMVGWQKEKHAIDRVAVNLSVQQIDGETILPLVRRILDETGLRPASLELEVTESMIMREPEKATAALQGFRAMGIELAIDDFGTGYSSLNYLKHLPINRLKIDQSFVRDIGGDPNSEAISRAIIGLARSLELETVAEGIEHPHQRDFLRREGCLIGQGYLFSRPVPAEQVIAAYRTEKDRSTH
ncbi:MAG: hypothetical protein Kow0060_18120 [Methylohalobius crimeensis]